MFDPLLYLFVAGGIATMRSKVEGGGLWIVFVAVEEGTGFEGEASLVVAVVLFVVRSRICGGDSVGWSVGGNGRNPSSMNASSGIHS